MIARLIRNIRSFSRNRIPAQLVIQMTNHCNAQCPQCGMRATADIRRTRLAPDEIRRILDAAGQSGVQAVSFTGGEPFLFEQDLIPFIHYAGRAGIPYIRTGTNGFIFRHPMSISQEGLRRGLSAVYAATATDAVVRFSAAEKAVLYKILLNTIPAFRDRLRIFTPLSSIYRLHRFQGDGGRQRFCGPGAEMVRIRQPGLQAGDAALRESFTGSSLRG